jgi:hypothetical protein
MEQLLTDSKNMGKPVARGTCTCNIVLRKYDEKKKQQMGEKIQ